ncbi:MAG: hypothetical protein HY735_14535 [Verrucomicrobia bacterium]|nr:hypothetical protein [Verrucomicrobiota bacterium]
MSSHTESSTFGSLELARWRQLPTWLMAGGGLLALIGAAVDLQRFGYAWLLAFMFFLSLCLGALFLVILHHLFDAMWTVPLRRFVEHIACLAPVMLALFLPILVLAPKLYPWMTIDPETDHALHAKHQFLNAPLWYVRVFVLFGIWTWLAYGLRKWSLKQDETGAAECTYKMRRYSAGGIFLFAVTLTMAAIDWMKSLEHQWYSTMYGVYYFAASVWTTLATVYLITVVLKHAGPLRYVARERQFHDTGVLLFAFTVFYAYIHFSQYFLIWNAALPEETYWYVKRETGSWWDIGMIIVFGHFVLPFLTLLRIDAKLNLRVMVPICVWAWLMHFCDLSYNIMPVRHAAGFPAQWLWLDLACLAFFGGVLAKAFLKSFNAHPPYPQRDPRFAETMEVYLPPASSGRQASAHGGAK